MAHRQAYLFGWIYGYLAKTLDIEDYDPRGEKVSKAVMYPLAGFAQIHQKAISEKTITPDVLKTLSKALEEIVDLDDLDENNTGKPISLELQGSWFLGYYHAKSGNARVPKYDIAARRKIKGLTQEQLAEKLGVDQALISRWERDIINPSEENLSKLKEILD